MDEKEVMNVAQELLDKQQIPSAVYRLQMSRDFPFRKAADLAPYLKELGIEALYASPYFEAVPASSHGYDVICPNRLNPELGTDADFDALCSALEDAELGHILDFVANHMSATHHNPWWCDVLLKGSDSEYADYFDARPGVKLKLPILDAPLSAAIKSGDVKREGDWIVACGHRLPYRGEGELLELLEQQHYELCDWREGSGYRRFFDIAKLAAVRQENPEVFAHYHQLALELVCAGKAMGMRIDHPDGLYDPLRYFDDLQALYFLEKLIHEIEGRGETVDVDVCLNVVSKIDLKREKPLYLLAEKILHDTEELPVEMSVHGTVGYDFLVRLSGLFVDGKQERAFDQLYGQFGDDPEDALYEIKKRYLKEHLRGELDHLVECIGGYEEELIELLACFPVYRTYIVDEVSKRDQKILDEAFKRAEKRAPKLNFEPLKLLKSEMMPFQQLSAPLMAKGFEDTFFYVYNRLICLNEVGGNPIQFGTSIEEFHRHNERRLELWPYGLITTDTHDTKRSMDVRMRIAAITELTDEWKAFLEEMPKAPDPNFGYFFYQTLVGMYEPGCEERLVEYCIKAVKEAKVFTSWHEPNLEYEEKVERFVRKAAMSHPLIEKVRALGKKNSLSAIVLKIGAPGVFDLYQGSEFWKYCLVDPDNRRPVDFEARKKALHDGSHPKLSLLAKGLNFRKEHKDLILKGRYIPLKSGYGTVAYAREHEGKRMVVAARRFFTKEEPLDYELPRGWDGPWQSLFDSLEYCILLG